MMQRIKVNARIVGAALVAAAALAAFAPSAAAQCQYSVQEWAPWQCSPGWSWPHQGTGLNNLGAWCGWRPMCAPGDGYLAVYCPPNGTPQVLPMPPGATSWGAQATGVNDTGVVVGYLSQGISNSIQKGCIWFPDGAVVEIPPFPGETFSRANAINNHNDVVGIGNVSSYILSKGIMTPIPTPYGTVRAITDSRVVVGYMLQNGLSRGFSWHAGEQVILAPHGPFLESTAWSVNNLGVVAGTSFTYLGTAGYATMPTLWIDGISTTLPLPAGFVRGAARAINDAGVVVGEARTATTGGTIVPVAWLNGAVFKINDLTVLGSPIIGGLIAANNSGQLLNSGSARVLTPLGQSFADVNGDCAVDGADIAKLLGEWGPREWSVADLDGDGVVDGRDLGIMLGEWSDASK